MRIAIVPARGGSKRIKRKNIVDFCGRPLLAYPLRAAGESGLFDVIHVSTEDKEIAETANALGFAPQFLRDRALADDATPLMPVLKWVLERYVASDRCFDTVALLMPTAPLIEAVDLTAACAVFDAHGRTRPVLAVAPYPVPIEWAMRLDKGDGLTMLNPAKQQVRSQDLAPAYYDSGTFAFFPPERILAYPKISTDYFAYRISREKAVDIDTPEDLALAETLLRGRAPRPR